LTRFKDRLAQLLKRTQSAITYAVRRGRFSMTSPGITLGPLFGGIMASYAGLRWPFVHGIGDALHHEKTGAVQSTTLQQAAEG